MGLCSCDTQPVSSGYNKKKMKKFANALEGGHSMYKLLSKLVSGVNVPPGALPHSCNKVQLECALYDVQLRLKTRRWATWSEV